jgi:hypothetical protein
LIVSVFSRSDMSFKIPADRMENVLCEQLQSKFLRKPPVFQWSGGALGVKSLLDFLIFTKIF